MRNSRFKIAVLVMACVTQLMGLQPTECERAATTLGRLFNPVHSEPLKEIALADMRDFVGLTMDIARNVGHSRNGKDRLSQEEAKRTLGSLFPIYQRLETQNGQAPTVDELRKAVKVHIESELFRAPTTIETTPESQTRFERGMITPEDAKLKGLPDFVVKLLSDYLVGEGVAGNAEGRAHREPFPYNHANPEYFYRTFIKHQRNLVIDSLIRETNLIELIPQLIKNIEGSPLGVTLNDGTQIRMINDPVLKYGSPTKETVKTIEFTRGQQRYTLSTETSTDPLTPGPSVTFRVYHPNGKEIAGEFIYLKAGMSEALTRLLIANDSENYRNGSLGPATRNIYEAGVETLKHNEKLVPERLRVQSVHLDDFMRAMSALQNHLGETQKSTDLLELSNKIRTQEDKLNTEFTQRYQLVDKYKAILAELRKSKKALEISSDTYRISFANNGVTGAQYINGKKERYSFKGVGQLMVLSNGDYEQLKQVVNLNALKKGELTVDLYAGKDKRWLGRLHIDATGRAVEVPDSLTMGMLFEDLDVVDKQLLKKEEE